MCKDIKELEGLVEDLRSFKALKSEAEANISAIQSEILAYLHENEVPEKSEVYGTNFSVKWGNRHTSRFDKAKLEEVFGDSVKSFMKTSTYECLYIN